MEAAPRSGGGGAIADYFKFEERGTNMATEIRGGLTTFMVMVYIVFVNAAILGDGFGLDVAGRAAVSAGTALIAGIMTIAMGVIGNYPFALAAGLGINAAAGTFQTDKDINDALGSLTAALSTLRAQASSFQCSAMINSSSRPPGDGPSPPPGAPP